MTYEVVSSGMRVNVHDYSGHPFQAQLSRNLAARGHTVLHTYCDQYVSGHGRLTRCVDDPVGLEFESVSAAATPVKYSPVGRARFELSYARAWQKQLEGREFDLVIACNVPLFALARMRRYFNRHHQRWMLWHQDVYSLGVSAEAARVLPTPAAYVADRIVQRIERNQVRSADSVIAISDHFLRQYERWGLAADNVHVIPNWAPLDELVPGERENPWSIRHELPTKPVRLLYAGTLGRKHNALLLVELLDAARARGVDATLTIISQGVGAEQLKAEAVRRPEVRVLDYQPAEDFSHVLASGDVLIALLEPDAAQFSVPSKVLSYLSAGRPIVALIPDGNPAAADVSAAGGFVAPPTSSGAVEAAEWLADVTHDGERLRGLGKRARAVAEQRFDIERIAAQFDEILQALVGRESNPGQVQAVAVARRV